MDWKDALGSLLDSGTLPEGEDSIREEEPTKPKRQKLNIILDKKGRKGKTATLIEGFDLPQEEVEQIARELKKRIGTGGSVRRGDILLQGDWREKAREILNEIL
ncbi:MAG: translation initiation factor [Clostridium sp.]|nr:translation initiation factor [Prevotella sp.]MCM1428391.1 translation initiation factor [Clostridium sp.]MCM1474863.1 translation initiation factor [Muribaculaceae bacterium]